MRIPGGAALSRKTLTNRGDRKSDGAGGLTSQRNSAGLEGRRRSFSTQAEPDRLVSPRDLACWWRIRTISNAIDRVRRSSRETVARAGWFARFSMVTDCPLFVCVDGPHILHHPFTAPHPETWASDSEPRDARARLYAVTARLAAAASASATRTQRPSRPAWDR